MAQAAQAGIPRDAEGLAKTEQEWLDHGLGNVSAVEAAAEEAAVEFWGRRGHAAQAAGGGPVCRRQLRGRTAEGPAEISLNFKVEEAVLKWRAALRTLTDPAGVPGASTRRFAEGWPSLAVGFLASKILSCRRPFWHQVRVLPLRFP